MLEEERLREISISRYEIVREKMKKELSDKLEKLDKSIIKQKKLSKEAKTLKEKIDLMKIVQELDAERSILRSNLFEFEDFIDAIVDTIINKL